MENNSINNLNQLVVSLNTIARSVLGLTNREISIEDILLYCNLESNHRYEILTIPKKHKKGFRVVYAPQDGLLVILKALNELLNSSYTPEKYVSGFVRNHSVVDNAYHHVGQQYLLNIDLKDFFEHIKYDVIVNKLTEKPYGFSPEVAQAIALLTCVISPKDNSICLAQGSPIAPIISNMIFEEIDRKIYNYCCSKYVRYSRYADDLSFSSSQNNFEESEFLTSISSILEERRFIINHNKTRLRNRSQRQEVTGIVVNIKPNVPREYIKDIRNLLYVWEKYGIKDAYLAFFFCHKRKWKRSPKEIPYFVNYLKGKISYLGLVRGRLDSTYLKFSNKFNSLIQVSSFESFDIRFKNLNDEIVKSGINFSTYHQKRDQLGHIRLFYNAGWYGKIYFDSDIQRQLTVRGGLIYAQEYFQKVLETNLSFTTNGVFLRATPTRRYKPLSFDVKTVLQLQEFSTNTRGWRIIDSRKLTIEERNALKSVVVVLSDFWVSAKFEYKNRSLKYIPMDKDSRQNLYVGEELEFEYIKIVTLTNGHRTIKRINYCYPY